MDNKSRCGCPACFWAEINEDAGKEIKEQLASGVCVAKIPDDDILDIPKTERNTDLVNEMLDLINHSEKIRYGNLYLCNRSDGVRGHWSIGRRHPNRRMWEFWTGNGWSAFGKLYSDVFEAKRELDTFLSKDS